MPRSSLAHLQARKLEPLDVQAGANGGISIDGAGGVHARALVTPGTVTLRSLQGPVTVTKAIAGSAGSGVASARPCGRRQGRDRRQRPPGRDHCWRSGCAGHGLSAFLVGSSFDLSGASIASSRAGRHSNLGAHPLRRRAHPWWRVAACRFRRRVDPSRSACRDGGETGGIQVTNAGSNVTLKAGVDVELNADVQAKAGTITISSTGGAVTARVAQPGGAPATEDSALDAGEDPDRSRIVVRAPGAITLGESARAISDRHRVVRIQRRPPQDARRHGTGYRNFANRLPDLGAAQRRAPARGSARRLG